MRYDSHLYDLIATVRDFDIYLRSTSEFVEFVHELVTGCVPCGVLSTHVQRSGCIDALFRRQQRQEAWPFLTRDGPPKSIRTFLYFEVLYMGVSKNRDTPKWMVKIMENPIKMDDLGGNPLFWETPI